MCKGNGHSLLIQAKAPIKKPPGVNRSGFLFGREERRGNSLTTITDENGNPWFVAKDVCGVLRIRNASDALSALDDVEITCIDIADVSIGAPKRTIINESGLYGLKPKSRWRTLWQA